MFTYADPRACPGCRAPLTSPALSCAACGLSLTGPAPAPGLRDAGARRPARGRAVRPVPTPAAARPPRAAPRHARRPHRPAPSSRAGLSAASVPRILLGLGALCLVVAAVVFLAVAWAALGVGGRTGVLGVLTAVAAGLMAWLAARDLRAGAEAFACGRARPAGPRPRRRVAGRLAGDDRGRARSCCWRARSSPSPQPRRDAGPPPRPVGALVSAQVIGAMAVLAASARRARAPSTSATRSASSAPSSSVRRRSRRWDTSSGSGCWRSGPASGATGWWLALVAVGAGRLDELTVAHVWGELAVWPLARRHRPRRRRGRAASAADRGARGGRGGRRPPRHGRRHRGVVRRVRHASRPRGARRRRGVRRPRHPSGRRSGAGCAPPPRSSPPSASPRASSCWCWPRSPSSSSTTPGASAPSPPRRPRRALVLAAAPAGRCRGHRGRGDDRPALRRTPRPVGPGARSGASSWAPSRWCPRCTASRSWSPWSPCSPSAAPSPSGERSSSAPRSSPSRR